MNQEFHNTLKQLNKLQSIDTAINSLDTVRKNLNAKIETLKAQQKSNREKLARAKKQLTEKELKQRDLETRLKQQETLIEKLKSDMNSVKSQDAFSALESELKRANAKTDELSLQILDTIEGIEKSKPIAADFEKQVQAKNAEKDEEIKIAHEELLDLDAQQHELNIKRAAAEKTIDEKSLKIYNSVKSRKEDYVAIADAYIRNNEGICKACNMKLTAQQIIELTKNDNFVYCESCHRILFDALLLR